MSVLIIYIFALLGAFFHWICFRYGGSVESSLEEFADDLISKKNLRGMIGAVFGIGLVTIIVVGVIDPGTKRQAFAAGLGWTAVVGQSRSRRRRVVAA